MEIYRFESENYHLSLIAEVYRWRNKTKTMIILRERSYTGKAIVGQAVGSMAKKMKMPTPEMLKTTKIATPNMQGTIGMIKRIGLKK